MMRLSPATGRMLPVHLAASLKFPVPVNVFVPVVTVALAPNSDVLLLASVAVQLTVVTPRVKVDPDGGVHTAITPGQLSLAVTVKLTGAEHCPAAHGTLMLAGHVTEGG